MDINLNKHPGAPSWHPSIPGGRGALWLVLQTSIGSAHSKNTNKPRGGKQAAVSLDTHAALGRSARRARSQTHEHLLITITTAWPAILSSRPPRGFKLFSKPIPTKKQTRRDMICVGVTQHRPTRISHTSSTASLLVYSSLNQDESAAELDSLWSLHSVDPGSARPGLGSTFTLSYCCSCQRTQRASLDNHADKMDVCRKQPIF